MNFSWCVILILFFFLKNDVFSMDNLDSDCDDQTSSATFVTSVDERDIDVLGAPISRKMSVRQLSDVSLKKRKKIEKQRTVKVAICGGGIAGVTTAALLSNISEQNDSVIFEIYLFEQCDEILKGTSQLAHVLHAGAGEYWDDPETIADCQQHGEFYRSVLFPSIYKNHTKSVLYAQPPNTSPRVMKEARKQAKTLRKSKKRSTPQKAKPDSQQEVSPEVMEKLYKSSPSLGPTVVSRHDILMKNAERDAQLKQIIKNSRHITFVNNYTLCKIIKSEDRTFILEDTFSARYDVNFDHVFLTLWDQTDTILNTSFPRETHLSDHSSFHVQDRVMALFDIKSLSEKRKTAIMQRPNGGMFLPRDSYMAVGYRCLKGASYPREGECTIPHEDLLEHGQLIGEELQRIFGFSGDELKFAGAIKKTIVMRNGEDLSKRSYNPPLITPEGVVVAVPLKATFAATSAMDSIKLMLENMSPQYREFAEKWIEKIDLVDPRKTKGDLPEVFTLYQDANVDVADVLSEDISFIQGFERTAEGEALLEFYRCMQSARGTKPKRSASISAHSVRSCEDFSAASGIVHLKRSCSDPYADKVRGFQHSSSWAELSVSSASERK